MTNYAILYKDEADLLFYWERDEFEVAPGTSVVAIYRGNLASLSAQSFIDTNKGKKLKSLSPKEIADLL